MRRIFHQTGEALYWAYELDPMNDDAMHVLEMLDCRVLFSPEGLQKCVERWKQHEDKLKKMFKANHPRQAPEQEKTTIEEARALLQEFLKEKERKQVH